MVKKGLVSRTNTGNTLTVSVPPLFPNVPRFVCLLLLSSLPLQSSVAINTTPQQILNIEDALVSDDNPARNDGSLDYERCARLHNYLVAYAWMARYGRDAPDLDALASRSHCFMNEDTDAVRKRLVSSLNSFLDLIYDPEPGLFYWVNELAMELCDISFPLGDNDLEDKERFVVIYNTVPELGSHCLGVVYDQQLHRAAFPMTLEHSESVEPVDEHDDMWFPLETILTHWII